MKASQSRDFNDQGHGRAAAQRMIALAARCVADGSSVTKAVAMRFQDLTHTDLNEVGEALTRALISTDVGGQCQNPVQTLSWLALDVVAVLRFQLDSPNEDERVEAVQACSRLFSTFLEASRKALRVSSSDSSPAVNLAGDSLRAAVAESLLSGGCS